MNRVRNGGKAARSRFRVKMEVDGFLLKRDREDNTYSSQTRLISLPDGKFRQRSWKTGKG